MFRKASAAGAAGNGVVGSTPRWLPLAIVALLALTVVVVGGAWQRAQAQPASAVHVSWNSTLGQNILTNANGITLYIFTKDTAGSGMSVCTDACATYWPAFHAPADRLTLPAGATGVLGTIIGTDGTPQVTYNGMPLYYFYNDHQPGDVNGQGVNGVWYAAQP